MAVQDRVIAASLARNACIAATVYNRGAIILHVIGAQLQHMTLWHYTMDKEAAQKQQRKRERVNAPFRCGSSHNGALHCKEKGLLWLSRYRLSEKGPNFSSPAAGICLRRRLRRAALPQVPE